VGQKYISMPDIAPVIQLSWNVLKISIVIYSCEWSLNRKAMVSKTLH